MKVGIIGAGLAGLTLGNRLKCEFDILEKNLEVGGLCRSISENGWTFDIGGGHIIFSKDKKLLEYMLSFLGSNIVKNRRNTKIFIKGRLIKYPIENGLSDLSKEDNFYCFYHYIDAKIKQARGELKEPRNFKEWVYNNFGKGIAKIYLVPYNEKIWCCKSGELGLDWVADRVPQPPPEDVIKSSIGIETEGYTHQLFFYYPLRGGIQSFPKSLERKIESQVKKSVNIKKIKKNGEKWIVECEDGIRTYERLVSTIPLMEIAKILEGLPKYIADIIANLRYTSLVVVMLGLDAPLETNISWLYVPYYSDGRFNRIIFPHNFSPKTVPDGCSSILAETTCMEGDEVWRRTDSDIIKETARDLKKMNIIKKQKIRFAKVVRLKYAYVVYDLNYNKNISKIYDYFSKLGIERCGRFSEFKYLNMDATMNSAIQVANKLNKLSE